MGSIQVSVGQPQWSRPERRHNAAGTSFRAHHGCSPEPLHVWLPIDADLLMAPLPRLYMVVFPITAVSHAPRKREDKEQAHQDGCLF